MKILQEFQKAFAFLIIRSTASNSAKRLHLLQCQLMIIIFIIATGSLALFLFHDAKTFQEFSETFYPFSTTTVAVIRNLIYYYNRTKIFELIDRLEDVIEIRT